MSRRGALSPGNQKPETVLTYGEYFSAAEAFLRIIQEDSGVDVLSALDPVSVFLEKHGAFYHPSRVAVSGGSRRDEYVLNVALSETGREYLDNEYSTLKMLEKEYAYPFLPKVFACREIPVDASRSVSMFMGEWFSTYHEFHVSKRRQGGMQVVRVWDPENEDRFLSLDQAQSVYEQTAMILTACYDLETFEHVAAWHHAAGDFVVCLDEGQTPRVKLVTVRQYAPFLESGEVNAETVLNGLLLFLLNMSIHMRLDRLDGVAEICWIDDFAIKGTLAGFFKGLDLQRQNSRIPAGFIEYFISFLAGISAAEMLALFVTMADRVSPDSPDLPLIQSHLEGHADALYRVARTLM